MSTVRPFRRSFEFEVKEVTEQGEFSGLAAVYDIEDQGGDVIERGAFRETLKQRGSDVVILWQHDPRVVIGKGTVTDTPEGLVVKGKLALGVQAAKEAYELMREGLVRGLSFGYDVLKHTWRGSVRHLKEIRLHEISVVTFPMNPLALISGVKSMEDVLASLDTLSEEELRALAGHITSRLQKQDEVPASDEPPVELAAEMAAMAEEMAAIAADLEVRLEQVA